MEIVANFCMERQLQLEDITNVSPIDFMSKTMSIINNEKIILVLSSKDANPLLIDILKSINVLGASGEQILVYHKDNYFIDDFTDFDKNNLIRWYEKSIGDNDNILCQVCSKKYYYGDFHDCPEVQSISCPSCFYKYCSACLMKNVINTNLCCINCNQKWKGQLTIKKI